MVSWSNEAKKTEKESNTSRHTEQVGTEQGNARKREVRQVRKTLGEVRQEDAQGKEGKARQEISRRRDKGQMMVRSKYGPKKGDK